MKGDMDKINGASAAYIQGWLKRQEAAAGRCTSFGQLNPGAIFSLPGGLVSQVKLNEAQAWAASQLVGYASWERVVAIQ